jgi:hypothetical protein
VVQQQPRGRLRRRGFGASYASVRRLTWTRSVGSGDRSKPTDTNTGAWSRGRIISTRFLETILVDEKYSRLLPDRPVRIGGAWFREEVDLSESSFPFSLYFTNSRFDKSFDLNGADIGGSIGFWASAVNSTLDLYNATVGGSIFLRDRGSFRDIDLSAADIKATVVIDDSTVHKKLDLNSIRTGGSVLLRNGSFQDVELTGANIVGNVEADGSGFQKKLNLNSVQVGALFFFVTKRFFRM